MEKKFIFILSICFLSASSEAATISTSSDQSDISLTVYNNSLGLVRDTRSIELMKGKGELKFMDVASFIMPTTVHVESIEAPGSLEILEQNYEYDLMSQEKILSKYEGKNIRIINWNQNLDKQESVDATVLSSDAQIFKVKDEIYLGYPGVKVVPEIPNNLISKPTLSWLYENQAEGAQKIEATYLTSNISWSADYVAILDEKDENLNLSGWVTLENSSGASYENAKLKLVAGEVNRAAAQPAYGEVRAMKTAMYDSAVPNFQEKAFFEYHLYDLQRRTTIKNNQTKQIGLLNASDVSVRKEYAVHGQNYYFFQRFDGNTPKVPVHVLIKFENRKANRLGMPIPSGIVRVYKMDEDGGRQFVGEDRVEHTPIDEEIKLKLGEAFDIVAERVQTDYQVISNRIYQTEWEVTLKNHKDADILVSVYEPMTSEWKITNNNFPFKKKNSTTALFEIPVSKNGEIKLKYRVSVETQ